MLNGQLHPQRAPGAGSPYHTQTVEYHFYFPAAGEFPHYPVHVAKNERCWPSPSRSRFNVVEQPTQIDTRVLGLRLAARHGRRGARVPQQAQPAPHRTWTASPSACATRPFFRRCSRCSPQRHVYDHTLWSYGIKHNDVAGRPRVPAARRRVRRNQCGAYLDSPLLTIDPVARKTYQHLDYRPLVNARAHQLGRHREILNDRFHAQYHRLLKILSYAAQLDDEQRLDLAYYLLLQDRIEEALEAFAQVDPDELATQLQYDYFAAYLDFYQRRPEAGPGDRRAKYADHPVDRWRKAFAAIAAQLDEIDGKTRRRSSTRRTATSSRPSWPPPSRLSSSRSKPSKSRSTTRT